MKTKKCEKYLHIDFYQMNDGSEDVNFNSVGLSDFEIIGALTLYRDHIELIRLDKIRVIADSKNLK